MLQKSKSSSSFISSLLLVCKGIAMGMANKIPGVSGGIIALAAGFYEELIYSFSRFDGQAFNALRKQGFTAFYRHVNGRFLLFLFSGVGISFFSISLLLDVVLQTHPKQVMGGFLGMILASVYFIGKKEEKFQASHAINLTLGILFGFLLLWINPGTENDHWLFVFFCGMISITGMTLPGLSGSLLILILGNYNLLLVDAVNGLFFTLTDMVQGNGMGLADEERRRLLGVFVFFTLGSAFGLVVFSKLLNYLMKHYRRKLISLLMGFIIGSLGAVWPWTHKTLQENDQLNTMLTTQHSTFYLPKEWSSTTTSILIFIFLGALLVTLLEYYGTKKRT